MADIFMKQMLRQKAIYWGPGELQFDGQMRDTPPTNPEEIKCRWEEKQVEFLDKEGNKVLSKAVVMVDRDLQMLGFLWLGKLTEFPDLLDPTKNEGTFQIRGWEKIPNAKAKKFARIAYL